MTGDTSPPPSLHVTDIRLDYDSDGDTVRLTGDLMYSNHDTIVSVFLGSVDHPLHGVAQYLPHCPHLSALCIATMSNKDNRDLLVSVMPRLTQLSIVNYNGHLSDPADHCAALAAVMSLTQLVRVELYNVSLGDQGLEVTDAMTRLRTVVLGGGDGVSMTARAWNIFVSGLITLPQSVSVELQKTDIDEVTVRRIQTSPHVTVTDDGGEG